MYGAGYGRHAEKGGIPFRICFAPSDALDQARAWLGHDHAYFPQSGGDLGERMELAFARVFAEGVMEAVLIGSDIPGLTVDVIHDAFTAFATHDAVIGPANDGGYYLIGFKKSMFPPSIFRDMLWSTNSVFRETVERLRKAALSVFVMPECTDVDTVEDLRMLLARQEAQDAAGPRTLALIERHRRNIMK
jgi:rSAM/selenodomain-associated transferase 1